MADDPTMLDELLAGNAEPGQDGMMTPEQITAIEEGRVARAAEGGTQREPGRAGSPENQPGAEDIDAEVEALIEKLEKDPDAYQSLTDDEKATIVEYKAQIETALSEEDKKTYTIAGKVFTRAEVLDEMREKWLKGPQGEEINPSPEKLAAMIEGFVKSRNREQGHVQTVQQQQANAAQLEAIRQATMIQQQRVDDAIARREKLKGKIASAKAAAAVQVSEDEIYKEDGKLDMVKFKALQAKTAAQEALASLESDATEAEIRVAEENRSLYLSDVAALMAMGPQYKVDGDVRSIIETIAKGGSVDQTAREKLLDLEEIIMEARSKGRSVEDQYRLLLRRGQLAFMPSAHAAGNGKTANIPGIPTNAEQLTQMLRDLRRKEQAAPPGARGSGSTRRGGEQRRDATRLVEHDRTFLEGEPDPFLKELKYKG